MTGLSKKDLRKQAIAGRSGDQDAALSNLRQALLPYAGAALAGYWPIRGEADPRPVLRHWDGPVALPVVEAAGRPLRFRLWQGPLCSGAYAIPEPPPEAPEIWPDVVIVPLVGFDRRGGRLGYGGGFYDRTLAQLRPQAAIGFAFSNQELDRIPQEPTDVALSLIVTDKEIVHCQGITKT